jgi:tuberous sclerosis protein 2
MIIVRETMKIGVIYVARGQDNQRDILKNEKGSDSYEDFLASIGETVTLKNHLGFQAGLNFKTDGDKAVYFSDALTELMFHVATLMPTLETDEQAVNKKRYLFSLRIFIVDMLETIM